MHKIDKNTHRQELVETLHHGILHVGVDVARPVAVAQAEHALDNRQLRRRGIQTRHRQPVIDNHAGANNLAAAVYRARDQRHLQQRRQLVLVLDTRLGMHQTALVAQAHVRAHKHIVRDRLAEHLHPQDVGNDFLRLALEVRVDEGNVVVGGNDVAEGREALLDALDAHAVGERVAQVLQLLVRGGGGDEQALAVAGGEAADDAGARDGGADNGDDVGELGLEDAVKVFAGALGDEGVRVGEGGEDADPGGMKSVSSSG